jgi:hypothetical protein
MVVVRMPVNGLYCMLPPVVSTRPSGRKLMALQNRSHGIVCTLNVAEPGSQIAARYVVTVGSSSEPATISTRPVLSSATWIGLIGTVWDRSCHCPVALS